MRISDWSSDVCPSDLPCRFRRTRVRATDLAGEGKRRWFRSGARRYSRAAQDARRCRGANQKDRRRISGDGDLLRSEEHTSELQSLMRISYAVFCLKKKIDTPRPQERHSLDENTIRVTHR